MRIVFMGTPEFAVCSLDVIHQSEFEVVGVVTAPDRPAGRGRKLKASAVKEYALEHQLPVLQPLKLRDEDFLTRLQKLNADLFVVVAFRMLPEVVWKMPSKGTVNLHASLLPQYRGAAPINWAIINGDTKTGATTFFINEKIDEGEMIMHTELNISNDDNAGSLHDKLMEHGAQLLLKTLDKIASGKTQSIPQNFDIELKAAPKLNRENTRIDFSKTCNEVINLIRGLDPYPGAYCFLNNGEESIQVKVFKAQLSTQMDSTKPGTLETNDKNLLSIKCKDGKINLTELQIQGKKRMKIAELLNGFKINPNSFWS